MRESWLRPHIVAVGLRPSPRSEDGSQGDHAASVCELKLERSKGVNGWTDGQDRPVRGLVEFRRNGRRRFAAVENRHYGTSDQANDCCECPRSRNEVVEVVAPTGGRSHERTHPMSIRTMLREEVETAHGNEG